MKDRGKVARALADKISMAAKIDYFKGQFIGDKLIKGLEEKFK
jgi:nucleolar protein 56